MPILCSPESLTPDYAWLDSGDGRRLERFGSVRVDRPAPGATHPRGAPAARWRDADLRFIRAASPPLPPDASPSPSAYSAPAPHNAAASSFADRVPETMPGWHGVAPASWTVRLEALGVVMTLAPLDGGQVGVFPEQWPVAALLAGTRPRRVLHVFAHTGAATLAAAASGAETEVVHVDASRSAVARARENAARSGLSDRPIRWVVDDALSFLRRERKRERRYDAILFDPPAFGRGPRHKGGADWRFGRDVPELVALGEALLSEEAVFFGMCWHAVGEDDALARRTTRRAMASRAGGKFRTEALTLSSSTAEGADGSPLACGHVAWWMP